MRTICPRFLRYMIHCFASTIILKAERQADRKRKKKSVKLHQIWEDLGEWEGEGGSGKKNAYMYQSFH